MSLDGRPGPEGRIPNVAQGHKLQPRDAKASRQALRPGQKTARVHGRGLLKAERQRRDSPLQAEPWKGGPEHLSWAEQLVLGPTACFRQSSLGA